MTLHLYAVFYKYGPGWLSPLPTFVAQEEPLPDGRIDSLANYSSDKYEIHEVALLTNVDLEVRVVQKKPQIITTPASRTEVVEKEPANPDYPEIEPMGDDEDDDAAR